MPVAPKVASDPEGKAGQGRIACKGLRERVLWDRADATGDDESPCLLFEHPAALYEVPDRWPHHDDITDMVLLPAVSAAKGTLASVGKDSSIRWDAFCSPCKSAGHDTGGCFSLTSVRGCEIRLVVTL